MKNFEKISGRLTVFQIFIILITSLIFIRFFYLQVFQWKKYSESSRKNMIRTRRIQPQRGDILDRNGKILAGTRPAFDLYVDLKVVSHPKQFIKKMEKYTGLKLYDTFKKNRLGGKEQVKIAEDVPRKVLAWVKAHQFFYPGLLIRVWHKRTYKKPFVQHVIGYIGRINSRELKKFRKKHKDYTMDDWVGKTGIESKYEFLLHGKSGSRIILVDAKGRVLKELKKVPPKKGDNIYLTIDADLQLEAEKLMAGKVGAIVAVNPKTGSVLSYVSSPGFNPEKFAKGITNRDWQDLIYDPLHPLVNRVIAGLYPPGSTFKPFVALAALQDGIITPKYTVFCKGYFKKGRDVFGCWKRGGHGLVDLHTSLVRSCDVYYYTLGDMLGIDNIYKYSIMFGFNRLTGIEIPGEKRGLIPSREWKKRVLHKPWYSGETIPVAIGQGYVLVTPIQLAQAYSILANRGIKPKIHVVKQIVNNRGGVYFKTKIKNIKIPINKEYFEPVIKGLIGVVNEPHGTGWRARLKNFTVAGKTGTAQVIRQHNMTEEEKRFKSYWHKDHGWFAAFAPADSPEIVVASIIEHGGHGGHAAAPIVGKLIEFYLNMKNSKKP